MDDFIECSKARYMEKPYPDFWYPVLEHLRDCEDEMVVSKVVVRACLRFDLSSRVKLTCIQPLQATCAGTRSATSQQTG